MRAILLIDHGSKREEANRMLECMASLVQHLAGRAVIVAHAHMELAAPSIAEGFAECVRRGAAEVVAFPYMLSPGKHSVNDIPRLVAEAAAGFPGTRFQVTPAFGVHEKLAEIILLRAGVEAARTMSPGEAACCWHPTRSATACGDACRARDGLAAAGSQLSAGSTLTDGREPMAES
ncbi:MAG TPA: CbiX/SirB N-terminal domain-containing protein [Gemmatimonadaceae bacterium]|nr:CbiX/SirB N-terminal domain-containing protein [Gemmatimonadaceae bacterium]